MTLIAGFFDGRCPILLGDLLVSDTEKLDKEFVFPTVGKVTKTHLSNGKHSPSQLNQKITLLSPKLAICCAKKKSMQNVLLRKF